MLYQAFCVVHLQPPSFAKMLFCFLTTLNLDCQTFQGSTSNCCVLSLKHVKYISTRLSLQSVFIINHFKILFSSNKERPHFCWSTVRSGHWLSIKEKFSCWNSLHVLALYLPILLLTSLHCDPLFMSCPNELLSLAVFCELMLCKQQTRCIGGRTLVNLASSHSFFLLYISRVLSESLTQKQERRALTSKRLVNL